MASKRIQTYVLGKAPWDDEANDYGPRPVLKQVRVVDGKTDFVQMEKPVAASLAEFRKEFPTEPVTGAPTTDEANLVISTLSDEELAKLGLSRVSEEAEEEEEPEPEVIKSSDQAEFADAEAQAVAEALGVSKDHLLPGGGTGDEGAYTSDDLRLLE